MERGLAQEVRSLLDSGVPEKCTAMQAIGYKEMAAALRGDGDVDRAAREIQLRSRQYAKRPAHLVPPERGGQMDHLGL